LKESGDYFQLFPSEITDGKNKSNKTNVKNETNNEQLTKSVQFKFYDQNENKEYMLSKDVSPQVLTSPNNKLDGNLQMEFNVVKPFDNFGTMNIGMCEIHKRNKELVC